MSRQATVLVENDLSGGLITEATALTFPPNAVIEQDNCIFKSTKNVVRRPGFNWESSKVFQPIGTNIDTIFSTYLWKEAGPSGGQDILVTQQGQYLYFFLTTNISTVSAARIDSTVNLADIAVPGAPSSTEFPCQYATGKGYLFVTHPFCEPIYLVYNGTTIDIGGINIEIRDLEGIYDALGVTERPTSISNEHKYNLYNQGWNDSTTYSLGITGGVESFGVGNVMDIWHTQRVTDYPSNADIWTLYRGPGYDKAAAQYPYVFRPDTMANSIQNGNAEAPKGRYILSAFNQDRSTVSGVAGIPVIDSSVYRPSTVAFFAGRVWYAGVKASGFSDKLYFTQILESSTEFGKCYMRNDPTSQTTFDILPTDGGVVSIADAGSIFKLFVLESNLIVFASNGIFSISGSQGIGFTATDYSVSKISSLYNTDNTTLVDVGGPPVWWSVEGIYTLASNDRGSLSVQSLTEKKIKEFYANIPALSKVYARGAYNPETKIIQWLYRSTAPVNTYTKSAFDKILNYNVETGAFYTWSVTNPSNLTSFGINGIVTVITGSTPIVKYIASYNNTALGYYVFSLAECNNQNYLDWADEGVYPYTSYFITGHRIHGEGIKRFQDNYINIYAQKCNTDSYLIIQGIWNFAIDTTTNNYTRAQTLYLPATDRGYKASRLRIPGMGLSLQLKFTSVSNAPFSIVGWSHYETVETTP